MKREIELLRAQIDATDDAIAQSIKTRAEIVAKLREAKAAHAVPFLDPKREQAIEERYRAALAEADPDRVHALVAAILQATR